MPTAPRANEWVEWIVPKPGEPQEGTARLSERALAWVAEVLGVAEKRGRLRDVEHACLDALEKKGLITQ